MMIGHLLEEIGRLKERVDRLESRLGQIERHGAELKSPDAEEPPAAIEHLGNVYCMPGVSLEKIKRRNRRKAVRHV